jgi:hypothetical protein
MNEQFKPSKKFLIRGTIAISIVAIVLIVQTNWFRALFNKPPLQPVASNKTVGDFVTQDTNGNGIADWEEKLWGLDPTVLFTNGVPNKNIIENKKLALGVKSDSEVGPENETDALARELLTITTALGQSGELTKDSLASVGARLAQSVEFQQYTNHYSIKDLRTVQTTTASLEAYRANFQKISAKYSDSASEIDIIANALETGDTRGLEKLPPIKKSYELYAKELVTVSVPIGIEAQHLEIINSIYGLSVAIGYMEEIPNNSANALAGVALYKINDMRLFTAIESLREYLIKYGILES